MSLFNPNIFTQNIINEITYVPVNKPFFDFKIFNIIIPIIIIIIIMCILKLKYKEHQGIESLSQPHQLKFKYI